MTHTRDTQWLVNSCLHLLSCSALRKTTQVVIQPVRKHTDELWSKLSFRKGTRIPLENQTNRKHNELWCKSNFRTGTQIPDFNSLLIYIYPYNNNNNNVCMYIYIYIYITYTHTYINKPEQYSQSPRTL